MTMLFEIYVYLEGRSHCKTLFLISIFVLFWCKKKCKNLKQDIYFRSKIVLDKIAGTDLRILNFGYFFLIH